MSHPRLQSLLVQGLQPPGYPGLPPLPLQINAAVATGLRRELLTGFPRIDFQQVIP